MAQAGIGNLAGGMGKFTELRQRLLFVLGALLVYRIGCYVPVPGVNPDAMLALMQAQLELFSAEHTDVAPETAAFLSLLQEQTERMAQMTKILLEMSELRTVPCDDRVELAPMIEEIFTDLAPLAESKCIALEADGGAVLTGSDPLLIERITVSRDTTLDEFKRELEIP